MPRKSRDASRARSPIPALGRRCTAEGGAPKGAVLLLGAVIALGAYATWYITSSHRIDTAHIVSPAPDRLEQLLNAPGAASPAGGYPMLADRGPAPHVVPIVPMAPHPAPPREMGSPRL